MNRISFLSNKYPSAVIIRRDTHSGKSSPTATPTTTISPTRRHINNLENFNIIRKFIIFISSKQEQWQQKWKPINFIFIFLEIGMAGQGSEESVRREHEMKKANSIYFPCAFRMAYREKEEEENNFLSIL